MKPNVKLAETTTGEGSRLALYEHDGSFCIRLNGQDLMHSKITASELLLGELVTANESDQKSPRILIGGLGLGFTLKSVLERLQVSGTVEVVELFPEVVAWNREFLLDLNGRLLDDPRVTVAVEDVCKVISRRSARYDGIVLDIDNGPSAMVQEANSRLYYAGGIKRIAAALKPGGRVVFWSAGKDLGFVDRLNEAGFRVTAVPAKLYPQAKRFACTIYLAQR